MANTFYTPSEAAQVAAALAAEDAFLSALVSRNYQDEAFAPGKGGAPIAVKQPTTLIARERGLDDTTSSIELDAITERTTSIELERKMVYSGVELTEADVALRIEDFSAQVLRPQCAAVVEDLEHRVASKLATVPEWAEKPDWDPANPVAFFTQLRKALRKNGVPTSGINVVVGTEVYAALLDAKAITDAAESGSTAALREGEVGRLRGMTIVESTRVEDDEIMAFHKDAVTLVTRAPAVPQGAPFGAAVAERGFSLRYLRDYDATKTADRSIVATFAAVAILPTYKITRGATGTAATVEELPNGGVIHAHVSAE